MSLIQRGGSDSIEYWYFGEFIVFKFDVNWINTLFVDALNNSHLYWFTGSVLCTILRFSFCGWFLGTSHFRRFQCEPNVTFLDTGNKYFETLTNVTLVDINLCQFKFVLWYNSLNVVAELNHNTVGINVWDETDVLFVLINFISIK